jgi:hypothetical protein
VSIQPTAGYLVNYHLSNHEVSKLYCNHMTSKSSVTCCLHLPMRVPVPAGTSKKPWPEPELCSFQRDRISSLFIE